MTRQEIVERIKSLTLGQQVEISEAYQALDDAVSICDPEQTENALVNLICTILGIDEGNDK